MDVSAFWVDVGADTKAFIIADGSDCRHANNSGKYEYGEAGKHLLIIKWDGEV